MATGLRRTPGSEDVAENEQYPFYEARVIYGYYDEDEDACDTRKKRYAGFCRKFRIWASS